MEVSKKAKPHKVLLSAGLILASAIYVSSQYLGNASTSLASQVTQPVTQAPAQPTSPAVSGLYADGTYTGSAADAYYGTVQVQAVIKGGKLASVQFLQYPNTHSTSVYINNQAMPILQSEAIQAQNSNVNIVSGATFTSQAFQQSLQSALQQAQA